MTHISKLFAGFLSAVAGALVICAIFHFTLWGKDAPPNITVSTTPINRDPKLGTSFAPIVKKAAPSVVNIYSTRIVREPQMMDNPFLRQFFGDQMPQENRARTRKEQSLGSGVIVSSDGYILTANHVVSGAEEIKVAIADNDKIEYTAKVIGTDPQTDVAILKINATGLPAITLGDSEQLEVGDVVLAIGNPFGVGETVTKGIVSGLGRYGWGISGFENFIQTDAAINPGNSGGALVDAEGRLIGINTAIIGNSGGYQGIGFAVPINMARRVMETLISGGKVTRGLLGVMPAGITPILAKSFDLADQNGALVDDVMPNTPAEKVGIKSGDVIVGFNGKKVTDAHDLILLVSDCAPGSTATVDLIHDGNPKTVTVMLAENTEAETGGNDENNSSAGNSTTDALDGVTVDDLSHDARDQLKIPDKVKGALVTNVDADSNSAEAGLQKGDVIVEINHQPVTDSDGAVKLCKEAKSDQILLKIWRREGNFAGMRWLGVDNTKKEK
jgi:serine protease Do